MSLQVDVALPLRNFELAVKFHSSSSVLGIFGRSGSGKTSLVETLCGLRSGAHGSIKLEGKWLLHSARHIRVPAHRRAIGYVPQGGVLFPDRPVIDNLRSGARHFGRKRASSLEEQVVETFELRDLLSARPTELSGGEAQRVALGRAVCAGARTLVLDEPTASLGTEFRFRVLPFLERVTSQFGLPMIVVSHEPLDLLTLCHEVIALQKGQLIAQGPPHDVIAQVTEEGQSFCNLLSGTVMSSTRELSCLRIDEAGGQLMYVAGKVGEKGQRAMVSVLANQVLLSRTRPEGISALNVLPARVERLFDRGRHQRVELSMGGGNAVLMCELTHSSRQRIALTEGSTVFAIIKAVSAWGAARPGVSAPSLAPVTGPEPPFSQDRRGAGNLTHRPGDSHER